MLRLLLALFAGVVATVSAAFAAPSVAQTLTVTMNHGHPRIEHLTSYVVDAPIAVTVHAPRAQTVTLSGVSPDGQNMRVRLDRSASGDYTGSLTLATAGVWSLALQTQLGPITNTTSSFSIQLAPGVPRAALATVAAVAFLLVATGLALLVYAWRRRAPAAPQLT
jgi:hypothetical protein